MYFTHLVFEKIVFLLSDWQVEVNKSSEEVTEEVTKEAGHGFFALFETVTMEITTKLKNLSQAMELQLLAMEKFGADFTVKSAAILEIPEACSVIQRLTFTLCIAHYQSKKSIHYMLLSADPLFVCALISAKKEDGSL